MAIDKCRYSFRDLATTVLPSHMKRMRIALKKPLSMSKFAQSGVGPKSILALVEHSKDFAGCYVIVKNKRPIYVGISRSVITRISQHVKGKTHFDASFAYRIATARFSHDMHRAVAMSDPKFRKEFSKARKYLNSSRVAFIEIENDLELYLFEAYCAMELKTSRWNTFRTH